MACVQKGEGSGCAGATTPAPAPARRLFPTEPTVTDAFSPMPRKLNSNCGAIVGQAACASQASQCKYDASTGICNPAPTPPPTPTPPAPPPASPSSGSSNDDDHGPRLPILGYGVDCSGIATSKGTMSLGFICGLVASALEICVLLSKRGTKVPLTGQVLWYATAGSCFAAFIFCAAAVGTFPGSGAHVQDNNGFVYENIPGYSYALAVVALLLFLAVAIGNLRQARIERQMEMQNGTTNALPLMQNQGTYAAPAQPYAQMGENKGY